ncbi:hypothetical protein [Streptomyces sp. RB17]|uniref:hypothetical protein n=1 Tax=Streptomyces sp. RB17 TaxID=2585197 RepID=UPI001296195A|nr:hypothetical protein [Streptomyces sp. RB17]
MRVADLVRTVAVELARPERAGGCARAPRGGGRLRASRRLLPEGRAARTAGRSRPDRYAIAEETVLGAPTGRGHFDVIGTASAAPSMIVGGAADAPPRAAPSPGARSSSA